MPREFLEPLFVIEKRVNESDERYEVCEIDDHYQVHDDG